MEKDSDRKPPEGYEFYEGNFVEQVDFVIGGKFVLDAMRKLGWIPPLPDKKDKIE